MAEYDKVVNDIIGAYGRAMSIEMPGSEMWQNRKRDNEALSAMVEEVKRLRTLTKPVPRTLGDLSDLPDELKAELSAIKTDDLEDQIFTIINAAGGEANIDTILVELFRRYSVVQKRTYITNKLWRMTQKDGLIWTAEGKGFYTTKEPQKNTKTISSDDEFLNSLLEASGEEIPF